MYRPYLIYTYNSGHRSRAHQIFTLVLVSCNLEWNSINLIMPTKEKNMHGTEAKILPLEFQDYLLDNAGNIQIARDSHVLGTLLIRRNIQYHLARAVGLGWLVFERNCLYTSAYSNLYIASWEICISKKVWLLPCTTIP